MDMHMLKEKNPWWQDKGRIFQDEKILAAAAVPVAFLPDLELEKGKVYVLRGPRQVGKTTFIKLKIQQLLEQNIEPRSILFYSCDQFRNFEQISETVETFVRWCESQGIAPHAIFLDEVTATTEWARAIKYLKNTGKLANAFVVVTGSNSVDLKRGAEKLPGRGIEGNEYFYYPVCFRTFCSLMGKPLPLPIPLEQLLSKEKDLEFNRTLADLSMDNELNRLFGIYLQTGGFLLAISNSIRNIPTTYETYARWIEGDLSYFRKDVRFAKQVLATINSKGASQFSINSIAKNTEIASPVTAKEYLSVFEDMQMLLPYYKYDISRKRLDYRKEKKYHFMDPLMYALVSAWTETKLPSEETIVEGVVASHAYRWAYSHSRRTGFYNDGKYEVDVVVWGRDGFIPLEVKWVEKLGSSDWKGLYKMGRGILLTKNEYGFEKGRYLQLPVRVLLALLDIPELIRIRYV